MACRDSCCPVFPLSLSKTRDLDVCLILPSLDKDGREILETGTSSLDAAQAKNILCAAFLLGTFSL